MGKIIKDGFTLMEYVNSGLIRKADDIPELKSQLIALGESKTHIEMSQYAILLAEHILDFSRVERSTAIEECFTVNRKWQNKEVKFQAARDVADVLNGLAREEQIPIKAKVLRAMGQVAATPHVKWHALAASEYAILIVNLLHPNNLGKVREERELQIELMNSV